MNLFEIANEEKKQAGMPLAARMRPRNFDEFVGQEHILGAGKLLRRAIIADRLSSAIFYGPAGTGKTALAQIIAKSTSSHFVRLNAVTAGVADIRTIIAEAKDQLSLYQRKTTLFVDEIHRFNKSQQDALLPFVEEGTVQLIGATTENPYIEVNGALRSRSTIFTFKLLELADLRKLLDNALQDKERGYGQLDVIIEEDAFKHIIDVADGDGRRALNALELAVLTTKPNPAGKLLIDLSTAEESIQKRMVRYDKNSDQHYDVVSAFIKSMRGSNPDAAAHYLVRMLEAGEDPRFITRRMMILAAEDIGLADPQALILAVATANALRELGLPEAAIPLMETCIYLAKAPKSNSAYLALQLAQKDVEQKNIGAVPAHLRDKSYVSKQEKEQDIYLYPHAYTNHYVEQEYLPEILQGVRYYNPSGIGQDQ
ncbi:MAG: replication-associated recombination protein A [Clostridia bacterium]